MNKKVIDKPTYMESIVSKCIEQLLDLIDYVKNIGIEEIAEIYVYCLLNYEFYLLEQSKSLMGSWLYLTNFTEWKGNRQAYIYIKHSIKVYWATFGSNGPC